jgi:hypothetical protein
MNLRKRSLLLAVVLVTKVLERGVRPGLRFVFVSAKGGGQEGHQACAIESGTLGTFLLQANKDISLCVSVLHSTVKSSAGEEDLAVTVAQAR